MLIMMKIYVYEYYLDYISLAKNFRKVVKFAVQMISKHWIQNFSLEQHLFKLNYAHIIILLYKL